YGEHCPIAVVYRASWPDEQIFQGTLATITSQLDATSIERTALILVGPALAENNFSESALYTATYDRRFRPRGGV
ncbi:MAG: precorrin-4 C(11)-methyltransferase, partial [Methylocystis sp.]